LVKAQGDVPYFAAIVQNGNNSNINPVFQLQSVQVQQLIVLVLHQGPDSAK
jgi:hypothetical protein